MVRDAHAGCLLANVGIVVRIKTVVSRRYSGAEVLTGLVLKKSPGAIMSVGVLVIDLAKLIAEKKDAIKSVCAKHGACDVRVFGSVARGDFDDKSDVDILIKLDSSNMEGMTYFRVLEEIHEELEALLGRPVDVVDEKGLKERLKADVLAEAIAL